jgi:hypothetical protein
MNLNPETMLILCFDFSHLSCEDDWTWDVFLSIELSASVKSKLFTVFEEEYFVEISPL